MFFRLSILIFFIALLALLPASGDPVACPIRHASSSRTGAALRLRCGFC
jgi:hypothetical protein